MPNRRSVKKNMYRKQLRSKKHKKLFKKRKTLKKTLRRKKTKLKGGSFLGIPFRRTAKKANLQKILSKIMSTFQGESVSKEYLFQKKKSQYERPELNPGEFYISASELKHGKNIFYGITFKSDDTLRIEYFYLNSKGKLMIRNSGQSLKDFIKKQGIKNFTTILKKDLNLDQPGVSEGIRKLWYVEREKILIEPGANIVEPQTELPQQPKNESYSVLRTNENQIGKYPPKPDTPNPTYIEFNPAQQAEPPLYNVVSPSNGKESGFKISPDIPVKIHHMKDN